MSLPVSYLFSFVRCFLNFVRLQSSSYGSRSSRYSLAFFASSSCPKSLGVPPRTCKRPGRRIFSQCLRPASRALWWSCVSCLARFTSSSPVLARPEPGEVWRDAYWRLEISSRWPFLFSCGGERHRGRSEWDVWNFRARICEEEVLCGPDSAAATSTSSSTTKSAEVAESAQTGKA